MHADHPRIRIDRFHAEEIEPLLSLYLDLFHDREPLTRCLGLARERLRVIARYLYTEANPDALARQLCWIARDPQAARPEIGLILCEDPATAGDLALPPALTAPEAEVFAAVTALFDAVHQPLRERPRADVGRCLRVAAIAVAPGYTGAGIATRLLQTALAQARAAGFREAVAECTSEASRLLHQRCGFSRLQGLSVDQFVFNDRRPFADCELEIHLMWQGLDAGAAD